MIFIFWVKLILDKTPEIPIYFGTRKTGKFFLFSLSLLDPLLKNYRNKKGSFHNIPSE